MHVLDFLNGTCCVETGRLLTEVREARRSDSNQTKLISSESLLTLLQAYNRTSILPSNTRMLYWRITGFIYHSLFGLLDV